VAARFLLLVGAGLLSACAAPRWVKPETSKSDFVQDQSILHEGASGTATLRSDKSAVVSDVHERARLEVTTMTRYFLLRLI
jgi:hypothetical protein